MRGRVIYCSMPLSTGIKIDGFVKSQDFSLVGIIEIGIAIEIEKPTGLCHEKPVHSITIPIAISIPMSRNVFYELVKIENPHMEANNSRVANCERGIMLHPPR
jgi:hypothetical protein